ncbi:MAG: PEGA domain-containing protein [Polyangiaceae bacterium]
MTDSKKASLVARTIAFVLVTSSSTAFAQTAPAATDGAKEAAPAAAPQAPSAAPSPPAAPTDEAKAEARERYTRGLQFFQEGEYGLALLEFQRAYDLAPSVRILYNIAQVNLQLQKYARALDALERYQKEAGATAGAERMAEVERDIKNLQARTARIVLTSDLDGAEIAIDDVPFGKTPFEAPLRVDAGQRRVSASFQGRALTTRVVVLAGGDTSKLDLALKELATPKGPTVVIGPRLPGETDGKIQTRTWILWGVTGATAGASAVFGGLALSAANDNARLRGALDNGSTKELADTASRAKNLALVSTIFTGVAAVAGGVSIYFTVKDLSSKRPTTGALQIDVGPGSLGLRGKF